MTVVKIADTDKYRLYVKGAPEYLMSHCKNYISENGQIVDLNEDKKIKIMENVVNSFAR
jgi:magnesium-transporting ATPase (P-type)